MKNISDFKEKETIFYLSLPDKNDWMGLKVIQGNFNDTKHWTNCVVSDNCMELDILIILIKDVLKEKCPKYNSNYPYRLHCSSASTIGTIKTTNEPLTSGQRPFNCFNDEEEANDAKNKIRDIIKPYLVE